MSAFETASKLVVEEIGKEKLHHVPSDADSKSVKLLSVVEDGIIKEWSTVDLQFKPKPFEEELGKIERRLIKDVDGKLSAELKEVFGCGVSAGSTVSYEADFGKFRWRKLKNHDSLIKHLKDGQLSISKKSGIVNKFWELLGRSHSFKIITSVVHTTSPTKITLIHQSEFGGSIKFKEPKGQMFKVEAGLGRSKFDQKVLHLPRNTPIAYGCVKVFHDESGLMKVEDETIFGGKVTPKQSSSTSAARETRGQKRKASDSAARETKGQKRKASESAGDASSTEKIKELEQKCVEQLEKMDEQQEKMDEQQEKMDKLEQEKIEEQEKARTAEKEKAEIKAELKREKEGRQKDTTAHRKKLEKQDSKIRLLEQQVAKKDKIIVKMNRRIRNLESKIRKMHGRWEELKTEKEDRISDKKNFEARLRALESKNDSQPWHMATTTKAVQEVPKPVSVEPKLAKDAADAADAEVRGTESGGVVAKVGQGTSSTLNLQTGKRE